MRKKRVWRYYCEYCKKSGCSSYHMQRHEIGCTNNPNRHCGMCDMAGGYQHDMDKLIEAALKGEKELRDLTEGCPACMLSAIRQAGLLKLDPENYFLNDSPWFLKFDYQKEKEGFWTEVNNALSASCY